MINSNKIGISSWIYAAIYLLWGILLYGLMPRCSETLKEMNIILRPPRGILLSMPSIVWLLINGVVAYLVISRDITGKRPLFPNWAVLTILIVSVVFFIYALFAPIIGFLDTGF